MTVIVAFGLVAASLLFLRQRFTPGDEPTPPAATPTADGRSVEPGLVDGRIVFVASTTEPASQPPTTIDGHDEDPPAPTQIYAAAPDGSSLTRLTSDPAPKGSLVWSPDGTLLAFTAYDLERGVEQLNVMRPDGSGRQTLCEGCTATFWVPPEDYICFDECGYIGPAPYTNTVAWSPDGKWIAAPQTRDRGLALIEALTGDVRQVGTAGLVQGTSWSPDSRKLAVSIAGRRAGEGGLFVLDVGSGHLEPLLDVGPYPGSPPAWSPDGKTIAYAKAVGEAHAELLMVDSHGKGTRSVLGADDLFEVYDLEWSPDGSRLAVAYHPVDPPTAGLLTMEPDGSDLQVVALCENGPDRDGLCPPNGGSIAWSGDGSAIAFSNFGGEHPREIVVVGSGLDAQTLSEGLTPGCCLAWQPSYGSGSDDGTS